MTGLARLLCQQGLLEAPVVKTDGSVLFSNVTSGGAFEYVAGASKTVVESRKGIGGLALHVDGGLVMTGRDVSHTGPVAAANPDPPSAPVSTVLPIAGLCRSDTRSLM
ncbi:hypothetical protein [Nocardia brasiliensis]|uniref:Uncharacterized protein n=1 Tax=Nocardia brasiliensis (strain ATCC 700358 / HUJEG-1) TaxID=1133849 RepID=K0EZJ1_NOCB7|nr:hypothetical protein [Nocardia brasiliensis]AFU02927.1 hypothetical protein O3I_024880 [Nocardia brasiliensis ATCC 700358]OCF86001.1 hypothetical protein AW168_33095 [Nocardia brasiliensis]